MKTTSVTSATKRRFYPPQFLPSLTRSSRSKIGIFILALVFGLPARDVPAQGTVNFANVINDPVHGRLVSLVRMPDVEYPFWPKFGNAALPDQPAGTQVYTGGRPMGPNYAVQLWAAPGADQPESELKPAFPIRTFGTTAGTGGAISPATVTLTNVPADCPVATVQVRAWGSIPWGENNWYGAQNAVGSVLGKSLLFNVEAIGGGTNPPANLINLRSFSLISNLYDSVATPLIYAQPQHQTAAIGETVTFKAGSACPAPNDSHWKFNGTNIVGAYSDSSTNLFSFPMLDGAGGILTLLRIGDFFTGFAVTNTIQLTNVQPAQAGIYSLVVTNFYHLALPPHERRFAISSNVVLTIGNPGTLTVSADGSSQVVLNWDGVFFLQSATNATGPFTDLPGPVVFSPYTNSGANDSRFFRLRK